jgi:hypothetical protein
MSKIKVNLQGQTSGPTLFINLQGQPSWSAIMAIHQGQGDKDASGRKQISALGNLT